MHLWQVVEHIQGESKECEEKNGKVCIKAEIEQIQSFILAESILEIVEMMKERNVVSIHKAATISNLPENKYKVVKI